ncbi:MAG: nucleotide sugar dehydrogenase [Thermoleophilia bacterium]
MSKNKRKVSVTGLGYVGLPVAVSFGSIERTIGFDVNSQRVDELNGSIDSINVVERQLLENADLIFTDDINELAKADFHIVAVPTPIDEAKQPDLTPLTAASQTIGQILKHNDIVVFESTVYPGATEEVLIPVLENSSGLICGTDFSVGYSPERINPGDTEHSFTSITKVVSGFDAETLDIVADTYGSVIDAKIHRAPSIKVAEAAKVIENTQRDLNIALMNECAMLFDRMEIDTAAVLAAAGTKWNFLKFQPGLVGGHCIGVDPYYLTHKAEKIGYIPQVILAGRRINDGMGRFIAQRALKEMIRAGHNFRESTVTVLGLAFKENCADIRNSRTIDIIRELIDFGINVQVHDPIADSAAAMKEYGVQLLTLDELKPASMVIAAVPHDQIRDLSIEKIKSLMGDNGVLIDVKGIYDVNSVIESGIRLWRL